MVPSDQKSDSHGPHRNAEHLRGADVALSSIMGRVSISGASKKFRLDKNPATGSVRTVLCRNLPTTLGLAGVPQNGDRSGKSTRTEVRQAQAFWTHTQIRSSCHSSYHILGERIVPMDSPDDCHTAPNPCCWGVRGCCSTFELSRSGARPGHAIAQSNDFSCTPVIRYFPTYLARGVCRLSALLLHRERPSR